MEEGTDLSNGQIVHSVTCLIMGDVCVVYIPGQVFLDVYKLVYRVSLLQCINT